MWKPLQVNKELWKHKKLEDEVLYLMNEMGAVDIRVLFSTEDSIEAIVFVPL